MKSFSKKLISLMLVALMLVAAMPMAAFADEADVQSDVATEATPVVVGDDTNSNTYNESGNTSGDIAFQDNGEATISAMIKVEGDATVEPSSSKRYNVKNTYVYDSSDKNSVNIAKKALSASGLKNASMYDIENAEIDETTGIFTITVSSKSHDCSKYGVVSDTGDEDVHTYTCSICGSTWNEGHTYKVSSKNADEHIEKCSKCGHEKTVKHSDDLETLYQGIGSDVKVNTVMNDGGENFTVVTAAKAATCTKKATFAKIKFDCGYTIGGEEDTDSVLAPHDYDSKGVCKVCGKKNDYTETYTVSIQLRDGTGVLNLNCDLPQATFDGLSSNSSSAKTVLKAILDKTSGLSSDQKKTVQNYYNNISNYFYKLERGGSTIDITVTADLSSVSSDGKITVRIVDGNDSYDRDLTVGKYYFDQLKITSSNRTLTAMKITNGTSIRTIYKNGTSLENKVQVGDDVCELIWDSAKVTLKFYRSIGSTDVLETRTIRAGQTIDTLPTLNGQSVNWYLPNGELLQEGRVYDFQSTTVNVYPKSTGFYLLIYKNGDTNNATRSEPYDISGLVQTSGSTYLISYSDLKNYVSKYVKGDKTYIFDFDGWEDYKTSKNTRSAIDSSITVNTSSDNGAVILYAMVTGASGSGSSSRADSSNPKTGDTAMIGTAFAVMAVAAIGLGTATVVLKKKEEF